jgi:hypothetical protein
MYGASLSTRLGVSMRSWLVLVVLSVASACGGGESGPPDAGPMYPDADFSNCLPVAERTEDCQIDLRGSVIEFVTGMRPEIAGAPRTTYVRVTTAFDGPTPFAAECLPLAEFPVPGAASTFNEANLPCDNPMNPPVIFLTIDDPPGAGNGVGSAAALFPVSSCTGSDCGALDIVLQVPLASDTTTWRQTLDGDHLPDAFVRGIVFVQFLEADGTAAAGVTPTIIEGGTERPLVPGSEVRFLAADRLTILGVTQAVTAPSGVAMVLLPRPDGIDANDAYGAQLGGNRTADVWAAQQAVFANGFIFMMTEQLP